MGEKGKVLLSPFSPKWGEPHASEEQVLILFMDLCVKTLAGLGRNYRWQRPERCPRCAGAENFKIDVALIVQLRFSDVGQ